MPALAASRALGPGGRASAIGLSKNARFHVNAGFAEISGSPVTVRMEIFSAAGAPLGAATRSAGPDGTVLVTDLITDRGLGTTENFRLDFTVTSPAGRIAPFAVLVDDGTGDGVFVPAEGEAPGRPLGRPGGRPRRRTRRAAGATSSGRISTSATSDRRRRP